MEQKQYGYTASAKSNENCERIGGSGKWGEVDRAGTVPEKRMHKENNQYEFMVGEIKTNPNSYQYQSVKGQGAAGTNWNTENFI